MLVLELIAHFSGVIIFEIINFLVPMLFSLGIIKATIRAYNKKHYDMKIFFDNSILKYFLRYLIGSILYALTIVVGTIFLIIPGIFFGIKFFYYDYFIVDRDLGVIDAFKASYNATKGYGLLIFGFSILLIIINLLGALILLIGLIVTIPITFLSMAYIYFTITKDVDDVDDVDNDIESQEKINGNI